MPQNVTLLGNRIFADVIKLQFLRQDNLGFRMGLKSMTGVCIREGERYIRHLKEKYGRGGHVKMKEEVSDACTNQGAPRVAGISHRLGEEHETNSTSEASEGTNLADNLISDVQSAEP